MRKKLKRYNIKRYAKIIPNRWLIEISASVKNMECGRRQAKRNGTYEVLDCSREALPSDWTVVKIYSNRTKKLLWVETRIEDKLN